MQEAEDAARLNAALDQVIGLPAAAAAAATAAPAASGLPRKLISCDRVTLAGPRSGLLLLLSDSIIVATGGAGSSSQSGPWKFRAHHALQSCFARLYEDSKAAKLQIMFEDADALLCSFESEERVRAWLDLFSVNLVSQLKYHPRSSKVCFPHVVVSLSNGKNKTKPQLFKMSAPGLRLSRFSMSSSSSSSLVLVRPVPARVSSLSHDCVFVLEGGPALFVFPGRKRRRRRRRTC